MYMHTNIRKYINTYKHVNIYEYEHVLNYINTGVCIRDTLPLNYIFTFGSASMLVNSYFVSHILVAYG